MVFGVGLSNAFFGDEGRELALELYSSPIEGFYKKGILIISEHLPMLSLLVFPTLVHLLLLLVWLELILVV